MKRFIKNCLLLFNKYYFFKCNASSVSLIDSSSNNRASLFIYGEISKGCNSELAHCKGKKGHANVFIC